MRPHLAPAPLALSLMLLPNGAHAANPPMQAGLWETQILSHEMDGKPMPNPTAQLAATLDKLPPEMRARMEAQMKAKGLHMGAAGSTPGSMRMCISQDMIKDNRWQQQETRCKNSAMSQSGNTWTMDFSCQNPEAKGEMRITFDGGASYISDMNMSSQRQGKATQMHIRTLAKWLGASCGELKPMNAAPAPAKP